MPSMIRLVYLLRRKPELSLEEFHRIWRDDHGPLVAFHQVRLDILRYVQLHYVEDPSYIPSRRGAQPAYDGAAEVWFESEETLKAAMESESGRGAMQEILVDEAGFIDLPESPLWLAHEYPQI